MKRTIHSSSKEWEPESHRDANDQGTKSLGQEAVYSMATTTVGDLWDEFVRDNWAPALEMDFGCDWRDKFSEEVIAILWWAVKNRNRFPGSGTSFQGTDDACNTVAGQLPQMTAVPQHYSLGTGISVEGIDDQQAPFSGLPLFGIANSQTSGAVQTADTLDLRGVPVLPLVDQFEDAPCMDLPDIGDPPFANDDDTDPEGPSNKMARLLEPGLDLSLSMEPLFGGLTLEDNSEDDILDNEELEGARMSPMRPDKLKVRSEGPLQATKRVKRTGGVKRQGEELAVQDQQGGSTASPINEPLNCCIASNSAPEHLDGRDSSPRSAQGKQPGVVGQCSGESSISYTLDTPYDPEHPGLELGNVVSCRSTSQPLMPGDKSGGFTFAGTDDTGCGPSVKKGTRCAGLKDCLDSVDLGQHDVQRGGEGECEVRPAMSDSAWPPFQGFHKPDVILGEPQKKAQKHRETDISGQGLMAQHITPQPDAWPQNLAGLEGQTYDTVPQFSGVSTGRPITFGAPPNLSGHTHPMATPGPSGALPMPVMNSVLRLGYYGIYPTAAWGVAAGSQQHVQPRVPGAPMFCVPSTIPSQFGVPMVEIGQSDGPTAPRGASVSQPGVMPPMYIMDNRATAHSLQHIIDGMDSLGRCPVHVAAMAGRADIIDQLIHVGCDCSKVLPIDIHGVAKKNWQLQDGPSESTMSQASRGLPCPTTYPPTQHESPSAELVPGGEIRSAPQTTPGVPPFTGNYSFQAPVPGPQDTPPGLLPGSTTYTPPNLRVERDPGVDELSFKFANALHLAAFYGHINVAELLLSNNRCDPQARNEHGCTPLHFAANRGKRLTMARLLKVQGMKIDLTDMHGRTALHHAAAQGHADAIDELWLWRCKFDAVDVRGWTALHYAAHAGHTEVVGKLVIAGCPVTKFDNRGYTPAHLAAQGGFDKVLEKLLHAGYDPDTLGGMTVLHGCGGSTALHMASACGHANVVRQLLRERSNALKEDFRGFSALQCAAEGGHFEAFTELLKAGCNPKAHDCCGTTVLHSAAKGGNWDIIQELLKLGCDHSLQTKFGCTALHHAAQGGAYQVAQNLLNLGCDIHVCDKDGNMPWHAAAEGGNLKVLELFLNKGQCNVEARNHAGCTALHCAARSGSIGAVQALLDRRADIKAVAADGQTALHYSMETGHDDVVTLLLDYLKSDTINLQDGNGWTVLHHAADRGNSQMVQLLIEKGAKINTQTNHGRTALHQSARGHYQGVAEALLVSGCNTSIRDYDGCTALHYAAQRANLPLFNLLFNTAKCKVGENDNKGFTLLHYAVEGGNPEIVGQLVFTGAAKSDSIDGRQGGLNALHLACKLGNAAVIPYLFKAGYKVGAKGPDGRVPLHFAALGNNGAWGRKDSSQHYHVVKMLLDSGADPHAVDRKGCNSLMYAAGSGDLEMVFKFLTMGVDCKLTDENNWTAMHWAATSGTGEVVTQLLKSGIPADTPDNKGRIPLHWAAERGHIGPVCAILDVMVQSKADIHRRDYSDTTPVQLAATRGHIDVVAKLLESGKTKDVKGLTALHLAAQMRLDEVAKLLLSTGKCDVNSRDADGCTPLHYSAENGNAAIVELLLKSGADLNITSSDGMMPIHKAASEGHLEAVNKLIDKGALVNFCTSTGSTPLHYAASTGKVDVLHRLIEAGCPVNAMSTGSVSCTALYCAASNGQLEAVDMLLDAGAEVDTVCTNECTALHVAASNGHAKAVKRLLDAGADMDLQAANGTAAIHNAVNNGHLEALEVLLLADCDVDVQNSGGNNALHIAASKGSQDLTKLLLNSDCDVHIKNAKGWQAVHSAASNGFFDVVLILVQHGSQWRQKGDLDVAKLLCRKSNLKNSYVEGRLRLAERERHRKAKPAEVTEAVPSKAELEEKRAQADAAMAALLQEEEEKKEEEEAKKAKRDAKRDKKKKKKGSKEEGVSKARDKVFDEMQKEKDVGSLEDSSGTNAPEDESCPAADTPDLEVVDSFAALSLSEANSTMAAYDKRQGGGLPKKTQKKKNRKKVDKIASRGDVDQPPQPIEQNEKAPEDAGSSGTKGTVKIIRCHNTGTPVISTTKQTAVNSSTSRDQSLHSSKSSRHSEWKENPAPARVISVPKSQVLLVNRVKRRMNDNGEGNGTSIGVQSLPRKAVDTTSGRISDATRSTQTPVAVTKHVTNALPRIPKNGQVPRQGHTPPQGPGTTKSSIFGSKSESGKPTTNVWQKPSPVIAASVPDLPKPALPKPTTSIQSSALTNGGSKPASALLIGETSSKPLVSTEPIKSTGAAEPGASAPSNHPAVQVSPEKSFSPSNPLSSENSAFSSNPKPWGPPGTMQGMRVPPSATHPTSAWAAAPKHPTAKACLNETELPMASVPAQFTSQCDAPGVGFPFPGRRELWGYVPPSPNSGPFLPGMHSGLGEQIVLPKGEQCSFTDCFGQDLGETASDFLRRQAQSRIAQACEATPWLNHELHAGGYKGEAPFPGMSHKSYGKQFNAGRNDKLSCDEKSSWVPNQQNHPVDGNGLGPTEDAGSDGLLVSRGNRGIASTSWEEPKMLPRHIPPPPPPPPPVPAGKVFGKRQFCCPLTNQLMQDPVVAADGFTYERSAIETWLHKHDRSPMSHKSMINKDLVPNLTMRAAIHLLGPIRK